jgi:hypothetical protein
MQISIDIISRQSHSFVIGEVAMDGLRRDGVLCDCTLIATDGSQFDVHRCVIASTSAFYRTLFMQRSNKLAPIIYNNRLPIMTRIAIDNDDNNNKKQRIITGIDRDSLQSIIQFTYTGTIEVF